MGARTGQVGEDEVGAVLGAGEDGWARSRGCVDAAGYARRSRCSAADAAACFERACDPATGLPMVSMLLCRSSLRVLADAG